MHGLKEEEANISKPMEGESREGTGLTYKKKDWSIRSARSIINAFNRELKSLYYRGYSMNELQFKKSADQPQSYALTKKLTFIEWY